jgi:hypothetical protein
MQDEALIQTLPPSRPRRSGKGTAFIAFFAFACGCGLAGWLVWNGTLSPILPEHAGRGASATITANPSPRAATLVAAAPADPQAVAAVSTVEARLALLEERLSRIDFQANAASGNASRAEALLIALSARRMIEKGAPLGYIEDQLKLRFADAQPQAVQTLISSARMPVTLDELSSQLDAMAPELAGTPRNESGWSRAKREFASLFVIRRAATAAVAPQDRVARARLMLGAGKIEEAIAEVERLPGGDDAQEWIATARRYDATQRALDLLETTAMLEPRRLRDDTGQTVNQPSPLAQPAPAPVAPAPVPSETTAAE